jgi:hypothetical protein
MNRSIYRLLEILFYAFVWEIGFLIPVQLFMRARILFENTTIFDYIILGIVIIGAFGILWWFIRTSLKKQIKIFLVIIGLLTLSGFIGFIIAPIRQFSNQILLHIVLGPIEIEQMVWLFVLIAGCGIVILGSVENLPLSNYHSLIQRIIEWFLAVIIHRLGYLLFPFESGVYCCLAFGSGILLLLSSAILPIQNSKIEQKSHQKTTPIPHSQMQKLICLIIFGITALLSAALVLLCLFTYFQILDEEREQFILVALLTNLALGLGIWGGLLIIPKLRNFIPLLIPFGIVGAVAGIFAWGKISTSFYLEWGQYVFLGIGGAGLWIYNCFVLDIIVASPTQRTVSLLWQYLTWLLTSYLSFIPFITSEWIVFASWIYKVLISLAILGFLNLLLIIYTWWWKHTRK